MTFPQNSLKRLAHSRSPHYFPPMQRLRDKTRIETGATLRAAASALALRLVLRRP
jgi:hypothetical protein